MESIFHEKQEGQLCAQHCLNGLLQGPYFTAVDLATLGHQMDDEERKKMAEGGENSEEYRRFLAAPSSNVDDSGFFSVQVIASALKKVWGLDLINYNSRNDIADGARDNPTLQKAYICNYREHWFTVRKIGTQWFNLNSLLEGPELISDTYLSLFLTQLQQEGYSIFIVNGVLPQNTADTVLAKRRVTQNNKPRLISEAVAAISGQREQQSHGEGVTDEERQFEMAIEMSLRANADTERRQLEAALALSLTPGTGPSELPTGSGARAPQFEPSSASFLSDEEMLDAALKMSLGRTS